MNRLLDAYYDKLDGTGEEAYEPTDAELEAMAAEHHAAISPKPFPCDPSEEDPVLNAWDLLVPKFMAPVIDRNQGWLQWTGRTTSEVMNALFINMDFYGMTDVDGMRRVSSALFDAGYVPSGQSLNPTWAFPV